MTVFAMRAQQRGDLGMTMLRGFVAFGPLLATVGSLAGCGGLADHDEGENPTMGLKTVMPAHDKAYVVRLSRAVLQAYFEQGRDEALEVVVPDAPAAATAPGPRLYVTLRNQGELRASYSGSGETLLDVVRSGVVRALEDDRFGGVLREEEAETTRLEFNAVFEAEALDERTVEGLAGQIEPGRHAIEFKNGNHGAFFKETVMITHNYDHKTAFEQLCEKAELPVDCYADEETHVERFRAEHWVEDPGETLGYFELFRGHSMVGPEEIRFELVERAARLNADYLTEHQTSTGAFDYQYQPDADELVEDDNTVRQAGASYAASKLASHFGDDTYVEVARRAIDNLLAHEQELEEGSFLYWNRDDLGVTALGLLGLVELEHPSVGEDYKDAALRLARGVAGQQTREGRLRSRFQSDEDSDSSQQFYPGEALLALVRTLRRWPEQGWLLGVIEDCFEYYRSFWRELGESSFVPWHAAAWANAYMLTNDKRYADFVFELVDWSVGQQNRSSYGSWTKDDYAGAYASPDWGPPNFGTATHSEPVPLAIEVARAVGDDARRKRYAVAERHALRFILELVIAERETFYMPAPERGLGGVRMSLSDNDVRIDAVQHAGTAFLHALEYLGDEPLALGEE